MKPAPFKSKLKSCGRRLSGTHFLTGIDWIAEHPLAGDVIKGACGARKVRWTVAGRGKSGGLRVIYFNLTEQGVVVLVMMYTKASRATVLPTDGDRGV